jgi:hypothetical protein
MQAFSRWQRMHPLAMLFLGASIGSACWLVAGATPAWAQGPESSTAPIQILKGAGPIESTPSSAGIQLRILKGVERTDYVLRPRIVIPTPRPARSILLRSGSLPSGEGAAINGFRSESILLPPIQETHKAPPRVAVRGHSTTSLAEQACENNKPNYTPFLFPFPFPVFFPGTGKDDPRSDHPRANRPEMAPSTNSLRSTQEKEESGPSAPTLPAPPSAATPRATQESGGQDRPAGNVLYDIAVLQAISTISASLMVSLAIVVSVFVLRRRLREPFPSFVQVNAPPLAQPEPPPAPEFRAEKPAEQTFDLGLTYEEERRLQEEADWQQEQAVLQTIFEDNVKLRQQLIELEAAAA